MKMNQEEKMRGATVAMFVSYCRRTIVNARTDVLRERARRKGRETLFCEMRPHEIECLACAADCYEDERLFDACGHPIGVTDERLSEALAALPDEERAIVLLSYFAGGSDRRIGEDLGFPRSTVQCRRARALARLRDSLREGGDPYAEGD